ncbi:MAG: low-specificity L-threonine aldolase [Candidatus Promineifilaceae bacterium]
MDRIDFRSDTVTWPTAEMRRAMAAAPLGDDVYGEDPSVNALEQLAAETLGKEAALFVASGTMGNLTAILSHATRGDEAIVGFDGHCLLHEGGGMATLGGVIPRALPTDGMGRMDLAAVEAAVNPDDPHYARTRLILLENSYGAKQGSAIPPGYFKAIRELAGRYGLAVHLDGARLFNAAAALAVAPGELVQDVDSVTFCLSKGLCAPVGSLLCGSAKFIHQARRVRKVLGGGMRQAGVLAAAGLIALRDMPGRLAEDHRRARQLAGRLAEVPGLLVRPEEVQTNMVFFDLEPDFPHDAEWVCDRLRQACGIYLDPNGPRSLRAVTHYWVRDADLEALAGGLRHVMARA